MTSRLTPKQAIFIAEYLLDGNATRAATAAGFSEKSATVTGARMLKTKRIAAVIAERRARQARKLEDAFDLACQRLASIALADLGKCYDKDNNRIPVAQLDDDTRAAVTAVDDETTETTATEDGKVTVSRRQKIKLADPIRATEVLGRRLGMFTDKLEHSGRLTLEDLVCSDRKRDSGAEEAA